MASGSLAGGRGRGRDAAPCFRHWILGAACRASLSIGGSAALARKVTGRWGGCCAAGPASDGGDCAGGGVSNGAGAAAHGRPAGLCWCRCCSDSAELCTVCRRVCTALRCIATASTEAPCAAELRRSVMDVASAAACAKGGCAAVLLLLLPASAPRLCCSAALMTALRRCVLHGGLLLRGPCRCGPKPHRRCLRRPQCRTACHRPLCAYCCWRGQQHRIMCWPLEGRLWRLCFRTPRQL